MRVKVLLPDRELVFHSVSHFEERWIEEDRILEFRCEFRSEDPEPPGRPVLARLRARLVVKWEAGFSPFTSPRFSLLKVKDLDFAVAVGEKKVYDVSGAVPKQDYESLVVGGGSNGSIRISYIIHRMNDSLKHMAEIRLRQTLG